MRALADWTERLRGLTGWSIGEVLNHIGCRQSSGELHVAHLATAERLVARVVATVDELMFLVGGANIEAAFRQPAGDSAGELRSQADEPWHDIYADAHAYVAEAAVSGDDPVQANANVRNALRDLAQQVVS